jgi:hypothetical protein
MKASNLGKADLPLDIIISIMKCLPHSNFESNCQKVCEWIHSTESFRFTESRYLQNKALLFAVITAGRILSDPKGYINDSHSVGDLLNQFLN